MLIPTFILRVVLNVADIGDRGRALCIAVCRHGSLTYIRNERFASMILNPSTTVNARGTTVTPPMPLRRQDIKEHTVSETARSDSCFNPAGREGSGGGKRMREEGVLNVIQTSYAECAFPFNERLFAARCAHGATPEIFVRWRAMRQPPND
jgi:hypothetical protein